MTRKGADMRESIVATASNAIPKTVCYPAEPTMMRAWFLWKEGNQGRLREQRWTVGFEIISEPASAPRFFADTDQAHAGPRGLPTFVGMTDVRG